MLEGRCWRGGAGGTVLDGTVLGTVFLDGTGPGEWVLGSGSWMTRFPGWQCADGTMQIAAGRKQGPLSSVHQAGPLTAGLGARPPVRGAQSTARKAQGPHGSRGVLQSPTETGTPRGTCGPFDAIPSGLRRTPR